jgi:hypothetical protein
LCLGDYCFVRGGSLKLDDVTCCAKILVEY